MSKTEFPARGRYLSGMERLWLVADRLHPPFVNQMVIEGEGEPSPAQGFEELLARLALVQPMARALLRGRLFRSRFVPDGPVMPFARIEAPLWDGCSPDGAPFLLKPLSLRRGPCCELLFVPGKPSRLILRTHHALADGQGTLLLARGLFALLRGEDPAPAPMGPVNDLLLAREFSAEPEKIPEPASAAPTGQAEGAELAVTWRRARYLGSPRRLLPRVGLAAARLAERPAGRRFLVAIPADLRHGTPYGSASPNLTGFLRLDLFEHLDRSDPLESVTEAIGRALESGAALGTPGASAFARYLPIGVMAALGKLDARRALRQNRYGSSAVLSNLGKLEMRQFSGGGFEAHRCFFIPPGNPGLPLFLAMSGDGDGVEFCATVPTALASSGRIEKLMAALLAA